MGEYNVRARARTAQFAIVQFTNNRLQEFNKMMGKYVWSDTMSEIKDSPGDIAFVKNPDGWNYAAPN